MRLLIGASGGGGGGAEEVSMSLCPSFANPTVACLVKDKCPCFFFLAMLWDFFLCFPIQNEKMPLRLKLNLDCCCRKLSPTFSQFWSSVGERKTGATFLSNVACRRNLLEGLIMHVPRMDNIIIYVNISEGNNGV